MYRFENIKHMSDGLALSARCQIDRNQSFFQGHFPGFPLMPAAAQLQMIELLIHQFSNWAVIISGGHNVKFAQRIVPDDVIGIHLVKKHNKTIQFSLDKLNAGMATKGVLTIREAVFG